MAARRVGIVLIAVGVVLGWSVLAEGAITFGFDPTGSGIPANFAPTKTLDWAPGNSLAAGGVTAIAAGIGGTMTAYTQNILGSYVKDDGTIVGVGGENITIVSSLSEKVASIAGNTATFDLAPGGGSVQVWDMGFGGVTPNNLLGTGFAGIPGKLILSAEVSSLDSNFTATGGGPGTAMDNFGSNDYPLISSVTGVGGTDLIARVVNWDASYFDFGAAPAPDLFLTLFNTSQILPFSQVDPSASFADAGGGAPDLGQVNGASGPDIQFQIDANQSFDNAVPEPVSALVWLIGLVGAAIVGLARRRRN